MNKLFVSDFDGTLNQIIPNQIDLNIEAIKKLRNNGFKFMLSTGRTYESIRKQIKKYNIPYDYLSCNDGANIFTSNDNLIKSFYLDSFSVEDLLEKCHKFTSGKLKLYGQYGTTTDIDKTVEIYIQSSFIDMLRTKSNLKIILEHHPKLALVYGLNMFFIENKNGKSKSINYINSKENFDRIVTIGDNINDLDMLQQFEGHKVVTCIPNLYGKKINTVLSVNSLANKILTEEEQPKQKRIIL